MFPAVIFPGGRRGPAVIVADPISAQPQRLPLSVTLDVLVSTVGSPMNALVVTTSEDTAFDRAAIDVAMRSSYSPGTAKCVPERMHYTFVETLGPAI
jgi:outer membrane biosynthesis protein TonB